MSNLFTVGYQGGKISGVNIYRGITTGYNPAFIINKDFKNKLIKIDNNSLRIIKPLLQGRDIKRWVYRNSDYSLLQTGF